MKWKYSLLILVVISLISLAACKSDEKVNQEQEVNEPEEEVVQKEPEPKEPAFKNIYPLTGIGTNEEINNRPVAVMINNAKPARPQTGLEQADIVFEVLAEARITRLLAIFHSQKPENIGPVRSARPYFIELSQGYNALYIAHGYSKQAEEILNSGVIDHLNGMRYDGILFERDQSRVAPHNSYITYENILKGAEENNFSMEKEINTLPFVSEEEMDTITGETANEITITYGKSNIVSYKFNQATNTYSRFSDNEQTIDRDTTNPIELENIFIMEAPHWFIDSYPRRGIDLESGGNGLLIQNGVVQRVNWKNESGQIIPYLDGEKVGFVPGQTWINIIPEDEGIDQLISIK